MKYLYKLLIFSFITIFSSLSVSAQNAFTNPSFEGSQGMGIVPAPWVKCGVTTPDTQPNQFGIDLPPSDGFTYISVLSGSSSGTPEALSQNLSCPLKTGNRYSFTVDVAFDSSNFGGALEIWAGMGTCAKTQLLASVTPTINDVWQTKTITFIATSNWTSITFTGKSMPPPSRFILLDNLSPIMRTGPSGGATVTTVNASCDGLGNNDGSATVTAPADGTAWQYSWSPGGQTTPTITDLAPGAYTCTVSDPNDACSPIIVKANIYGPLPLTVTATPETICSGQTSQLQANVAASPPPTCTHTLRLYKNGSAWAAPASVKVYLNGVLSGTYSKTSTSLFQDFPFNVTQGDAIQLEYTTTGVVNGDRFHSFELHDVYFTTVYVTTAVDVTTSGVKWNGVANCGYTPPTYSYTWTPATTLSNATIPNPIANPTITTTYEVSVSSSNSPGCPTKKQITVTVLNPSAIALTSATGTDAQNVCQNIAISDITFAVNNATGANVTGLPAGLTGTYTSGIFTISGTPTVLGTFNYTVSTSGGCLPDATTTGTITITSLPIITLTSAATTSNQIICQNIAISDITYAINNATGANVTGLPTGLTGTYTSGIFTISGTPTVSGTFNYTVTTSGGCLPDATTTGTITVTPLPIITLTSAATTNTQTVCQNIAISDITYAVNNATGANVTGLPAGLTGTYASGIFTISGTPPVLGTFNYTISTSGGCLPDATTTGTITITPLPIITLTSAATTCNQTVCQNTAISDITYAINYATGANITGLPAGLTGTYASGIFTISGTPTVSGTFNYTVTTSGGCYTMVTGTISVNPIMTPTFTAVDPICSGESFTLLTTSNEGITGTWWPEFNNTTTTTYTFTPDTGQCASVEIMIIEIREDCEIPKGISPNGDGLNDVLDLSNFNITKLSIFNRYGMAAYTHGFGYKNQWYGQSNSGQELPDGTYFYVIDLVEGQTLTGWIYINREK